MGTFKVEHWMPGEKPQLVSIGYDKVIVEYADGSRMYVTAESNGVRIRAVQAAMSVPLSVRPECTNAVRVEFGTE